jgi:transcriptional regulator with XRE-family HTH domain
MTRQGGWPATGFAGRLRAVREQAGLSQRQLADRAGCNVFTLSKLERGTQEPAWPLVLALARALGVDCTAFQPTGEEPAEKPARPRGRPRKGAAEEDKPAPRRKRGGKA